MKITELKFYFQFFNVIQGFAEVPKFETNYISQPALLKASASGAHLDLEYQQ